MYAPYYGILALVIPTGQRLLLFPFTLATLSPPDDILIVSPWKLSLERGRMLLTSVSLEPNVGPRSQLFTVHRLLGVPNLTHGVLPAVCSAICPELETIRSRISSPGGFSSLGMLSLRKACLIGR